MVHYNYSVIGAGSAGCVVSPKLLMPSGIGDAEQLQALEIPVVADLPGVGQNLQDHPIVSVVHQSIQDLQAASTSSIAEAGLFVHTEGNQDIAPDLQFLFGTVLLPPPGYTGSGAGSTNLVSEVVMVTTPMNPNGLVLQPGQGKSYWVLGDLYTFKTVSQDTNGTYSLIEITVYPQTGSPPHIHSREDESFLIQSGELQFQIDGQTLVATPGTFIYSPKGQTHLFANISNQIAKMLCWITPAGLEQFFMEIGIPVTDSTAPPPPVTEADIQKTIALAPQYGLTILPPGSAVK
jgi:mannose-6-phosphate isomerase-like protein (cupin superfamily)